MVYDIIEPKIIIEESLKIYLQERNIELEKIELDYKKHVLTELAKAEDSIEHFLYNFIHYLFNYPIVISSQEKKPRELWLKIQLENFKDLKEEIPPHCHYMIDDFRKDMLIKYRIQDIPIYNRWFHIEERDSTYFLGIKRQNNERITRDSMCIVFQSLWNQDVIQLAQKKDQIVDCIFGLNKELSHNKLNKLIIEYGFSGDYSLKSFEKSILILQAAIDLIETAKIRKEKKMNKERLQRKNEKEIIRIAKIHR